MYVHKIAMVTYDVFIYTEIFKHVAEPLPAGRAGIHEELVIMVVIRSVQPLIKSLPQRSSKY